MLELFKPGGTCIQTPQEYYSRVFQGGVLTIYHRFPSTGAIGEFGSCGETYLMGNVAPGSYRIEWLEEITGDSNNFRSIAQLNLQVVGVAMPVPIPTIGNRYVLALLITLLCLTVASPTRRRTPKLLTQGLAASSNSSDLSNTRSTG